jgi:hypothetical protein
MRDLAKYRRMLSLAGALVGVLALPAIASAQSKIYPPGTDCGNQPTLAERLHCGRQEFRRQQGMSVEQPSVTAPAPLDEDRPFPETPAPPAELRPAPNQMQVPPRTASPTH